MPVIRPQEDPRFGPGTEVNQIKDSKTSKSRNLNKRPIWALMRSHELNGPLFVVKFTLSDPLGGPSCQFSYLERFQNDIPTCLIRSG